MHVRIINTVSACLLQQRQMTSRHLTLSHQHIDTLNSCQLQQRATHLTDDVTSSQTVFSLYISTNSSRNRLVAISPAPASIHHVNSVKTLQTSANAPSSE